MSIVAILEVAIGMIFAWLGMSLAGMYIQEWIVSKLGWRSDMLQTHIGNLLSDPALAKQFYDHPLIQGLHSGVDGTNRPAYIPSAEFSFALLDIIRNAPKEAALIQPILYELKTDVSKLSGNKRVQAQKQLAMAIDLTHRAVASDGGPEITGPMLDEVKKHIRKLSMDYPALQPKIEAKFLAFAAQKKQIDSILAAQKSQNTGLPGDEHADQFRTGLAVMSVTHPDLKQAIESMLNDLKEFSQKTEDAMLSVRKNIENWFNNSMDRLSGWYKRRAQTLAFIIGLTLAILLNVDSMQIVTQLWRDPSIRDALSAQADAIVNQNPAGNPTPDVGQLLALNEQIRQINIPIGWIGTVQSTNPNGAVLIGDGTEKLCTLAPQSGVDLFGFFLADHCYPLINTPQFNDLTGWLLKVLGLLITAVAAAQGAPFWFDILKNLVNVRSNGVNSDAAGVKAAKG
jgi:hypothetical protein